MSSDNTNTQKLNFSQRNGLEEINNVLQINSMDENLRTTLYNFCFNNFSTPPFVNKDIFYFKIHRKILYSDFFKRPLDEILNWDWNFEKKEFKAWFFDCKWNEIYDFFEFCFSQPTCQTLMISNEIRDFYLGCLPEIKIDSYRRETFTVELNSCLEKENSGYRMVNGCISQITDEHEIEAIKESLNLGKDGIKKHLTKSIEFLRNRDAKEPDFRNSIKESISAVEYLIRDITGASTLGDGLKELEKTGIKINVCLKEAFNKLYNYTNSEDGIRHAIMNNNNVPFEEAKFMLVACSAFINYITFKQSQLKN
ncbi:MAG: hypothetical protein LBB06_02565 [Endomicrobium sp.]|jgi:hypothetical protein|nr:hypothetical protein [Endomicrobium sp.]